MKAAAAFPFHTGYHVTGYSEKAFYLKFVKQKEIPGFLLLHLFSSTRKLREISLFGDSAGGWVNACCGLLRIFIEHFRIQKRIIALKKMYSLFVDQSLESCRCV